MVVLENAVANEQKLVTLMSSSGRISYCSSSFLRFLRPNFIEDEVLLHSKEKLQGKMRIFSKDMMNIFRFKSGVFKEITLDILKRNGIIYEEDLYRKVYGTGDNVEARFAIHKFLFEGKDWIKDGQWHLSENSSGPYTLRPRWQSELIEEAIAAINVNKDVIDFRRRVNECLIKKEQFKPITRLDQLILKCLKSFSEEFYVNAAMIDNPLKKIVTEAFLGVAIVDSQSQAKALLNKLERTDFLQCRSKPLMNSFINENLIVKDFNINKTIKDENFHDFGNLPVYLIDPIGTVEVDDGISVEITENDSKFVLHVHVADPSDFVNGKLEEEAKFRAETIYLPEMKIPMLPESVTQLTTLKVGGIKTLTFSCKIDLESGEISDQKIRRGIINNLKHFTYEEAEGIKGNSDIELMKKIREAHLKYRTSKGHLNFSFPRGIAQLDFENEKILVNLSDELLMKSVVAELMIIAGRIAGEYLKEHELAGPFRNHHIITELSNPQSLLEKYEILKSLESASVDFVPKRHSSMGLEAYVKVTSPLRRYLDLVTHKILKSEAHVYGIDWFKTNLKTIHRQEIYNKRLASAVNRFWIEKFIWQQEEANCEQIWTLTPLEKLKENLWMVHVNEVANNFMVVAKGKNIELGENVKSKIVGKSHETLLKFETIP